jgi:hypothetical protein
MRIYLQPAATLALLIGAGTVHAQITNPDKLVAPPPRPPQISNGPAEDNLQWLWTYTRDPDVNRMLDLRDDVRFKEMVRRNFTAPQAFWGANPSLADAIPLFLARYAHITTTDNRYITIDGCVRTFCPAHGLLWIDLGTQHPLIVFVGVNWSPTGHTVNEPASSYDMWVFSNHPLTPTTVPAPLAKSIAEWQKYLRSRGRIVPHVGHAILVDPMGRPTFILPELLGANGIPAQAAVSPADGVPDTPDTSKP